jgi:hypothetical protein
MAEGGCCLRSREINIFRICYTERDGYQYLSKAVISLYEWLLICCSRCPPSQNVDCYFVVFFHTRQCRQAPPISLKSECCKWESRKAHRTDILDYCHRAKCCRKRFTSSLHQVWFASCNNLTRMLFLASLKQTINNVKDGRSWVIEISSHCVSNHLHISNW